MKNNKKIKSDVTEHKDMEALLLKEKQEQQIILDSVPAWIFYKDDKNNFIRVNKAFADVMGVPKNELEGKSLFDIFPKKQAEQFLKDDKEVMESGKPKINIIESMESPKGTLWVQTDKIPYHDDKGNIIGIIGFTIDITARKQAEEKIINSQKLMQRIIDLLPIRIFWKDKDLKYLGCNDIFAKDAGKSEPKELIGKDDFQMGWKEQASLYQADDRNVIKSGKSKLNFEEPQTTPQGNKIWLNTSKVPLTDLHGNIFGILGSYEDISERKQAEEVIKAKIIEIEENNKLMIGRELKMIELKNENEELKKKISKK
jgi:PAS domain S-box-containing protein